MNPTPTPTPTPGLMCGLLGCDIGGLTDTITNALSFAVDPFGGIFKALQDSAKSLATDVLPAITEATLPDLTADWFLSAYAIAFAAALLLAVLLLIPQTIRTARGLMAGRELAASIGLYFPLFIGGAMFGPLIGILLVQFTHALSADVVAWSTQGAGGRIDVVGQFLSMIGSVNPGAMTGGIIVCIILMLLMVVGLVLVVMLLVVQLVTLYLTGILIPLGIVWFIDPGRRAYGFTLVRVWGGILASHPLLFFLLGVVFRFMGSSVTNSTQSDPLRAFITFVAALVALGMALFTPTLLLKFGAVLPTGSGAGSGPSFSGTSIGPRNLHEAADKTQRGRQSAGTAAGAFRQTQATSSAASAGATTAAAGTAAAGASSAGAASTLAATGTATSATGVGAAVGVPLLAAAVVTTAGSKVVEASKAAAEQAVAPMDSTPTIGPDQL
ncbi:hypothetical protein BH10ACT7_BH10ACT7_12090 [soil metagenome]